MLLFNNVWCEIGKEKNRILLRRFCMTQEIILKDSLPAMLGASTLCGYFLCGFLFMQNKLLDHRFIICSVLISCHEESQSFKLSIFIKATSKIKIKYFAHYVLPEHQIACSKSNSSSSKKKRFSHAIFRREL